MKKNGFCTITVLTVFVMTVIFAVGASAASNEVTLNAVSEIIKGNIKWFDLPDGCSYILGDEDTMSVTSGDYVTLTAAGNGTEFAEIKDPKSGECYALINLPEDTDLSSDAVGVSFYISGLIKEGQTRGHATVRLSLECGDITYTSSAPVAVNAPVRFLMDTASIPNDTVTSGLKVSFSFDESVMDVDLVSVSSPYTDSKHNFAFQRSSSLRWFSVLSGEAEFREDGFALISSSNSGNASSSADTAGDIIISIGSLTGVASGNASQGRITYCFVGASSGNGTVSADSTGDSSAVASPVGISPESGQCLFRVIDTSGIRSTTFTFWPSSDDGTLFIDSIGYITTDEQVTELKNTISTLTFSDGRLHVEGRLVDSAIKDYMGSKLGLYMLTPCWDGDPILIAEASVSSRFSLDVSLANYPRAESENKFFLALTDRSGNLVCLSEPRFASSPAGKTADGSCFGLYGADPVAVYESRASYIIADVDISRLCSASSASDTALSRGDYVIGINSEYLSELDSNINFYRSAGISVYARLICTSPIRSRSTDEALTYSSADANEFVFRTDSREAVETYMSVVSFLCERYQNIASVIVSSGLNSRSLTGIDRSDTYSYVCRAANLVRLTYSAANEKSSGVLVTVPYDCTDEADISASVFTALLAERLYVIGPVSWGTMYTLDSPNPTQESSSAIASAKSNGTASPAYSVFIWSPEEPSGLAESYRDLCSKCDTAQTKVIFLSVCDIADYVGHEEYRMLRHAMKDDVTLMLDADTADLSNIDASGSRVLWDFSNAFSTFGWSIGYGIEELRTAPMGLEAENEKRVLRCRTSSGDGNTAGILLCTPDSPMLLSSSPYIRFTFRCNQDEISGVVFIFGSGNNRVEFTLQGVSSNGDGTYSAVCDISEFTKLYSVEYFGIILYSEASVVFELSEIRALSTSFSDEELADNGLQSGMTADDRSQLLRIAVSVCAVIFIGFISFVMLGNLRRVDRRSSALR